ncbi:MAG: GTP-binding protein [Lachnospiraceae bacterium]
MQEIPIYLFSGFMDSGKTTLIRQTLVEQNFGEGTNTLLIVCEDGEIEYDEDEMHKVHTTVVMISESDQFTEEKLHQLAEQYHPDQVFIEYNGTWGMDILMETNMPEGWIIIQSLATVDAVTFESYMQNMKTMMQEQLFSADVIIFNRCSENTPKRKFRSNIKTFNRPAQIVYERENGELDLTEEELPFDITQDRIEISDGDYAVWFMDCQENYKKYDRKKVAFTALVYNPDKMKKGLFVPGRFVMTCCADDITFLGFKCKYQNSKQIPHRSWIKIEAEVRIEFAKEYKGKGPVLYPVSVLMTEKPADELVYVS